jgi:replication initiation protein RepC
MLAAEVAADRMLLSITREKLSLCRRDLAKLIAAALEEGAPGNWMTVEEHFRGLVSRIPRSPLTNDISPILEEMEMLREEVLNLLETCLKSGKQSANESQNERHIQNSNPESTSDNEPAFEEKQDETSLGQVDPLVVALDRSGKGEGRVVSPANRDRLPDADADRGGGLKSFPLGFVLRACPEISLYGPGGAISNWRDMMAAGVVVRSMLGVSASAYEEACGVMGPENAATVMACLLERAEAINSAGGYLRDLTRRAARGEFAIGPMLMSLARANGAEGRISA